MVKRTSVKGPILKSFRFVSNIFFMTTYDPPTGFSKQLPETHVPKSVARFQHHLGGGSDESHRRPLQMPATEDGSGLLLTFGLCPFR